jgi:hypothetical protein
MRPDDDSRFEVAISGQLESGSFLSSLRSSTLAFKIVSPNPDSWCIISGKTSGMTPKASSSVNEFVWNYPIACAFSTDTPMGWPRLVVSVFTTDWKGRDIVFGYGVIPIPSQPGRHVREIKLFTPAASSWWTVVSGWLLGHRPTLLDPETFLTNPNEGISTVMMTPREGSITVNFIIGIKCPDHLNLRFC